MDIRDELKELNAVFAITKPLVGFDPSQHGVEQET
jgi:hypothetical protein